jgi:hypothetical protein
MTAIGSDDRGNRPLAIVVAVRRICAAYNRRPLTYADFLAVCQREGIDVSEHDQGPEARLLRADLRPRVSLRRGLTDTYRTFVAWHELGHWVLHPHASTYYFERHELDRVEQEANFVGALAVRPWPRPPAVATLTTRLSDVVNVRPGGPSVWTLYLGARRRRRRYRFRRFA